MPKQPVTEYRPRSGASPDMERAIRKMRDDLYQLRRMLKSLTGDDSTGSGDLDAEADTNYINTKTFGSSTETPVLEFWTPSFVVPRRRGNAGLPAGNILLLVPIEIYTAVRFNRVTYFGTGGGVGPHMETGLYDLDQSLVFNAVFTEAQIGAQAITTTVVERTVDAGFYWHGLTYKASLSADTSHVLDYDYTNSGNVILGYGGVTSGGNLPAVFTSITQPPDARRNPIFRFWHTDLTL